VLLFLLAVLCLGAYTILATGNNAPAIVTGITPAPTTPAHEPEESEDEDEDEPEVATTAHNIPLTQTHTTNLTNTGYLALVNHQHAAPPTQHHSQMAAAWPTVAVSRIDGMYLHESALVAVAEMFASARDADAGAFFLSSGYRDFYRQAYLYGDGSNGGYVMPPGHSEHQTGLAADILVVGIGMHELSNTPEGRWLAANAYRYGLILRYPEGATHITGVNYEPWHFRYVGPVHSYYIMHNGLVLEEYIQLVRERGHFSFEKNGQTHHIFHQTPEQGMIYVPYGQMYTVSADNKGGYIVWTTQS